MEWNFLIFFSKKMFQKEHCQGCIITQDFFDESSIKNLSGWVCDLTNHCNLSNCSKFPIITCEISMVSVNSWIGSSGPTFFKDLGKYPTPLLLLGCRVTFFSVANMNENGQWSHVGGETTSGISSQSYSFLKWISFVMLVHNVMNGKFFFEGLIFFKFFPTQSHFLGKVHRACVQSTKHKYSLQTAQRMCICNWNDFLVCLGFWIEVLFEFGAKSDWISFPISGFCG